MRPRSIPAITVLALLFIPPADAAGIDFRLLEAAKRNDPSAVYALLRQHVDVNAAQSDGATALMWAAHWNDSDLVDKLIRAGAKVNAANDYGVTALSLACLNGGVSVVHLLLKNGANPNAAQSGGETPLMIAARTGNSEAAAALISHGADVNAKEHWRGQTALMFAVSAGHSDVARRLIESGADIHARTALGMTPLLFAARDGDVESIRALLAAGAGVNETSPDGSTPLLLASHNGEEKAAALLLEQHADVNAADDSGFTPLHAIVWRHLGEVNLVKLLLQHGAHPNARLTESPIGLPGEIGNLRSPYGSLAGATPFLIAAKAADVVVMRVLADGGSDPQLATNAGATPLMLAAGMGRGEGSDQTSSGELTRALEAVKLCVELGADVNAINQFGQTAMHAAASTSADAVVQYLFDHGARVDIRDKQGRSPFDLTQGNADFSLTVRASTAALLQKLSVSASPGTAK
jgi:uncharacterized protein